MTPAQWIDLQSQLWGAFGPLVSWWLAFLLAGSIDAVIFVYAAVYFSEWVNG